MTRTPLLSIPLFASFLKDGGCPLQGSAIVIVFHGNLSVRSFPYGGGSVAFSLHGVYPICGVVAGSAGVCCPVFCQSMETRKIELFYVDWVYDEF